MPFRLSAKKFALTYPQVPESWTCELVLEYISKFGELVTYVIGEEEHKDGGKHYHVYARYVDKIDTRNANYFDILSCHGNYQAVKKESAWTAYCMKNGKFLQNYLFTTWRNFTAEQTNFDAWRDYQMANRMKEIIWPISVFGYPVSLPDSTEKKINWLIVGRSDSGKTRWVEDTFGGFKIFKVMDPLYPFEGIDGETVLIWDDWFPKRKDLIAASNLYKTRTLVGRTRYRRFYWKMNQRRMIFILNNELPIYATDEWFNARFNVLYISKGEPTDHSRINNIPNPNPSVEIENSNASGGNEMSGGF